MASLCAVLGIAGCGTNTSIDAAMTLVDAGTFDAGASDASSVDAGRDASSVDAAIAALDVPTAPTDAFAEEDAGSPGTDAPITVDAAAELDASVSVDAHVGLDAFTAAADTSVPDAFVGIADAFVATADASRPDAFAVTFADARPVASDDATSITPDAFASPDARLVSYAADVQPILVRYCGGCHGGTAGLDVFSYASTQAPSSACGPGTTKGACSLLRIENGSMPAGRGCTGDPAVDSRNPSCLTAPELAILRAWVAGGQLP